VSGDVIASRAVSIRAKGGAEWLVPPGPAATLAHILNAAPTVRTWSYRAMPVVLPMFYDPYMPAFYVTFTDGSTLFLDIPDRRRRNAGIAAEMLLCCPVEYMALDRRDVTRLCTRLAGREGQ
jgi:hypothetical protein